MEINFREVKDDLLKKWLDLREENGLAFLNEEDKNILLILMRFANEF